MRRRTTATDRAGGGHARKAAGLWVVVLLPAAVAACGGTPPPQSPSPGRQSPPNVMELPPAEPPAPHPLREPPPSEAGFEVIAPDPILVSPWAREDRTVERVTWWLDYWRTRASDRFVRALVRMGRYDDYIDAELAVRGLPPSLRYLPIIEAGYQTRVVSPAGAGGLWQFMPATARWLGLEVGSLVDQRFDPYAATPRALDYLASLYEQFGSWFLALAAYNGGPGRLERVLAETGHARPWNDEIFHRIRHRLPAETRDFVPKFLAAARVAEDPAGFGLTGYTSDRPRSFDVVRVPGQASIDVIAGAAGAVEEELRALNPQLVLGLVPAGRTTAVRVPQGSGPGFDARFAAIPEEDRVTLTHHRVTAGETLSEIARNYRVALRALRAANPEVEPRLLQIGTLLVVPRAPD